MPVIGIVLSGCGVFDGAEIHEAVLTLYFLRKAGADVLFMAPRRPQLHVINHLTGEESVNETRDVLVESARIARGEIQDIATVHEDLVDALIFPGGFGAAKNLCDFALKGEDCTVDDHVERLVREMRDAGKPIGSICISPALLARVLGERDGAELTIGTDPDTAGKIERMGSTHVPCPVDGIVVDGERKIVTTPAYMLASDITETAAGIEKLVDRILTMVSD
jgi:enhancing lycopene biosynthesis protein 2